jgi:hypothetical protein
LEPPPNQPPTPSITAPADGATFQLGQPVGFSGSGNDPEDGALSGSALVWTSSLDGQIGTGASFDHSGLSLGAHTITLTAIDSEGATGQAARSVTIEPPPNQPPTPSINAPADGATFQLGQQVGFSGSGNDPEDGALSGSELVWTSSLDGQIGTSASFDHSGLSLGAHTITLTATDSDGATGQASRSIAIEPPPNQPPTASITAPADGTTFQLGQPVAFNGAGNDPEDGALSGSALVWTSSLDGQIGSGASFDHSGLSLGTHTITLTATDSDGATGQANRSISIEPPPNQPPTVSITAPAQGATFQLGQPVRFSGSGNDPEDGALSGSALVWTSSLDGQIGTGASFDHSGLSLGAHTITLTATDSDGATGQASRSIAIEPPPSDDFETLVGAGDIAVCGSPHDEATADLLDGIPGTVFTAGDNVYYSGTPQEFTDCYDPSWGRHRARTRPAAGNHDYDTPGAAGYYAYFGANAGDPSTGYYSYDLGAWHVVVVNSNLGVAAGSAQLQWLAADLAANPTACTVAYWHHPRFSSGVYGNDASMQALWEVLYDAGVDLVLNGHEHMYERFARQTPTGALDNDRGIREIIVGTGGISLRPFGTIAANSQARDSDTHGVLRLSLYPTRYEWDFLPIAGGSFTDSGGTDCHS